MLQNLLPYGLAKTLRQKIFKGFEVFEDFTLKVFRLKFISYIPYMWRLYLACFYPDVLLQYYEIIGA